MITTWVKGTMRDITAQRFTTPNRAEADAFAKHNGDNERKVTRSMIYYREPTTGERKRAFVVTVRPKPSWVTFAEKATGYGVTGNEPTREPTAQDKEEARKDKKAR